MKWSSIFWTRRFDAATADCACTTSSQTGADERGVRSLLTVNEAAFGPTGCQSLIAEVIRTELGLIPHSWGTGCMLTVRAIRLWTRSSGENRTVNDAATIGRRDVTAVCSEPGQGSLAYGLRTLATPFSFRSSDPIEALGERTPTRVLSRS